MENNLLSYGHFGQVFCWFFM